MSRAEPRTYIQTVRTLWTEASRGAPAAGKRNATPEAVALPAISADGPVLWHVVTFSEVSGFELEDRVHHPAELQGQYHEVALRPSPHGVTVLALGWTQIEVKPGETASLIFNEYEDVPTDDWRVRQYRKVCFHLALDVRWSADLFQREPDHALRKMHVLP